MDKEAPAPRRFAWVPEALPGVTKLMRQRRQQLGDAHVNECWRRGVVLAEPGWFFAREGAIAIGAPWSDPEIANFAALQVTSGQALLILRPKG